MHSTINLEVRDRKVLVEAEDLEDKLVDLGLIFLKDKVVLIWET